MEIYDYINNIPNEIYEIILYKINNGDDLVNINDIRSFVSNKNYWLNKIKYDFEGLGIDFSYIPNTFISNDNPNKIINYYNDIKTFDHMIIGRYHGMYDLWFKKDKLDNILKYLSKYNLNYRISIENINGLFMSAENVDQVYKLYVEEIGGNQYGVFDDNYKIFIIPEDMIYNIIFYGNILFKTN